jgi:two-component system cell cycle sensor histidine kinase/response regulator CckA
MKDQSKTKQALIQEMASLKQRIAELEQAQSERNPAENALREGEERFRSLIQSLSDMIFVIDRNGQLTYESPSVSRILGYQPGHFIGKSPFTHIHPDDLDTVVKDLDEVVQEVNPGLPTAFRYQKADNTWVYLEALGSNHYHNPAIQGVVITARDITKRKRVESAFRKSEAEKTVILESVSDLIFYIGTDMRVIYSNLALEKFFNLPSGSLGGKVCYEALHHRDKPCRVCPALKAMESGSPREAYTSSLGRHWRLRGYPVMDESGTITGAIEAVSDITDLRNMEEKYRSIFDNAVEGIYQTTLDGRLIAANPALAEMFGYDSPESMMSEVTSVGRSLYADPDRRQEFLLQVEERGIAKNFEFEGSKRDGERIYISDTARAVKDSKGNTIYYEGIVQDITDRKRAEDALRKSEERFKAIFNSTFQFTGLLTLDGTLVEANQAALDFAGITIKDIVNRPFWEARWWWGDEARVQKLKDAIKMASGGEFIRYEVELQGAGETTAMIDFSLKPVYGASGEIILLIPEGRDVTERKWAEDALRESENRFAAIFNTQQNGIVIIDPETHTIVDANAAALDMIGGTRGDVIGHECHKFICPAERGKCPVTDLGIDVDRSERVLVRIDHTELSILKTVRRMKLGSKDFFIEGFIDITDRKRVEDALRESEERFRALSENAPDIIYTMNLEGAVTYANPSWKRILGHDEEDLLGRYFTDFAREEDRNAYRKLFKTIRDDGKIVSSYIGVMLTKGGKELVFNMNSAFNRDSKGRMIGVVGTLTDITEQREMEKKLQQAQKLEAIGTLAGGIAHDFNNLLMGIQGYASLTLLDLDASHPHYERLKRIEQQVQSGADLTKQLLGFARGGKYEARPTDMNTIIDRTASMFGRTKKEITLYRSLAQDLWTVDCDQGQMEQVLMNLYVNAWQAMPGGGDLSLETGNVLLGDSHALPFTLKPGRYVKVSVTDTGTGMDAKTVERIFDPFFTTKGMGRGTGLGLAMVYGIVKGHGGIIDVTSEPGQGTTFDIYLPASEKAIVKEQTAATEILTGTETVLLVDDERMVLEVTRELLESLGYRVHAAGGGQEAIAVYMERRKEIDLVILDMIMPGISGGETFDRLKEINPNIRVLLSSGYSIKGRAQEILERGCNGFLQKPFQLEKLSRKVREVLTTS